MTTPVRDVFAVLDALLRHGAAKAVLSPGQVPVLVADGAPIELDRNPVDPAWISRQLGTLFGPHPCDQDVRTVFRYRYGPARFQVEITPDRSIAIRLAGHT